MMSRKPSVVIMPVFAPLRLMSVFVARVVPWMISSTWPRKLGEVRVP